MQEVGQFSELLRSEDVRDVMWTVPLTISPHTRVVDVGGRVLATITTFDIARWVAGAP